MDVNDDPVEFRDRVFRQFRVFAGLRANRKRFTNTASFTAELNNTRSLKKKLVMKLGSYVNRLYFQLPGVQYRQNEALRIVEILPLRSIICQRLRRIDFDADQDLVVKEIIDILLDVLARPDILAKHNIKRDREMFAMIAYKVWDEGYQGFCFNANADSETVFNSEEIDSVDTGENGSSNPSKQEKDEQLYHSALAHIKQENFEEAIEIFTYLLEGRTDWEEGYYYRAVGYLELGDLIKCKNDLDRAISLDPNDADFFYVRGMCLYDLMDFEYALVELNTAIRIENDNSLYYDLRSKIFLKLGDKISSDADAEKAKDLEKNQKK
jgi:tetratricopeptide (TPR) repeat protein